MAANRDGSSTAVHDAPVATAPAPDSPPTTLQRQVPLAEQAYLSLREQIATRSLRPGSKITERSLAERLGVSPTPIREALRRLEQEGLILRAGPRSLTVVEHSTESLAELQYAEVVLRAAVARFAATKSTESQIAELTAKVDELERLATTGTPDELLESAHRFDEIVAQIADSPAVVSLYRSAEVVGRARRLDAIREMQERRQDVGVRHLIAHRELIAALAAHDADRAERVMREHLLSSRDLLLSDLAGDSGAPVAGEGDQA